MNLLIKNANIIDCCHSFFGDVYIENGKIKEIGIELTKQCQVIDAKGLTLLPTFIDTHVHFREPGFTYKEDIQSGSKAAVKGGFTGVNLMANTNPICSTKEVLEYVYEKAAKVGIADIHQCVSITKDFDGKTIDHLKVFGDEVKAISDDGKGVVDSRVMMEAMKIAKEKDWIIISHAENHEFSDIDMRLAENMMTWRDLTLAKVTGCKLHMAHVSTKEAIKYIIEAKEEGVNVTSEVTPHHIALDDEISNYRVNPPIRTKEDVNFLIRAIAQGNVDVIGTDHAPHSEEDKAKGAPGMTGIELAFPICYTKLVKENIITLNRLSEMMSSKPAELLGMNKGKIAPGYDGDIVLVDLDKKITVNSEDLVSKGKNTPFVGWEFYGDIILTVKEGRIVYTK
ncbi:dihydroorotase [Clostridium polyendosporum]|uniref:Dihydroorotase n=1 Tax=Clostridium polyendosporum TaxID=69208 RepID=A0A919S3E8_9CLOT|nr:dihydroorotase [Clostridium polyendosporum]GIM30493.1 dihydroorotase [Clostridium polyendosporum]